MMRYYGPKDAGDEETGNYGGNRMYYTPQIGRDGPKRKNPFKRIFVTFCLLLTIAGGLVGWNWINGLLHQAPNPYHSSSCPVVTYSGHKYEYTTFTLSDDAYPGDTGAQEIPEEIAGPHSVTCQLGVIDPAQVQIKPADYDPNNQGWAVIAGTAKNGKPLAVYVPVHNGSPDTVNVSNSFAQFGVKFVGIYLYSSTPDGTPTTVNTSREEIFNEVKQVVFSHLGLNKIPYSGKLLPFLP